MIKALIFDFDGTIVDTEYAAYDSWRNILSDYGVDLPLELWMSCVGGGKNPFDPVQYLEVQCGQRFDRSSLVRRQERDHVERVNEEPLRAGVREYLKEARRLGLRVGLASSSSRSWVEPQLDRRGLRAFFEVIRTRDDVRRVKPDPELYRAVVHDLGLRPEECLAIEDSRNGLLAAKGAGLHCLVAPCSITRHLEFGEADFVLDSLADRGVASLIDALERTA